MQEFFSADSQAKADPQQPTGQSAGQPAGQSAGQSIDCQLRPAQRHDRQKIAALTRQLHRTAIPQSPWHYWVGGGMLGLILALAWHYPTVAMAMFLSTMPLWVAILLAFAIADHEQQSNWDQYWVLEYGDELVACGRLEIHHNHSEIYDLFVMPEWRQRGMGRRLMQQLIASARLPIYLASLPKATTFYQGLGFGPIAGDRLPHLLASRLSLTSPRYRQVGLQAMMLNHRLPSGHMP